MRVDAGGQETWAPVGIALALGVSAVAGLAGSGWAGRPIRTGSHEQSRPAS